VPPLPFPGSSPRRPGLAASAPPHPLCLAAPSRRARPRRVREQGMGPEGAGEPDPPASTPNPSGSAPGRPELARGGD